MSNIVCPECGKEQIADTKVCAECGFPLQTDNKNFFCRECGEPLNNEKNYCPNCGFENVTSELLKANTENSKNKLVGIVLITLACVMFVFSFSRVNNDKYNFYKQHYEDCMAGYEDSMDMANSSGALFRGSYKSIANSYENMAEDDMAEINKYRIQAVLFLAAGVVLVYFGCKSLKKKEA